MCATLLATFHCVTTTHFTTCKFHRMSHAQHRNLKAFKWFAGHVACNAASLTPSKQATLPRNFSSPLCRRRKSRARTLSSISLPLLTLSLVSLRSHVSGLPKKKSFVSKTISLSRERKYSLARLQKRNFELEFFALARTVRAAREHFSLSSLCHRCTQNRFY